MMPEDRRPVENPIPVAVYIRTLNEERCLRSVLEAAKQLTDDIVVVDSGSTDGTLEIADSCGARVIHQKWLGSGHQKRVGEDHCRHDWVLDLDADEVVSDELVQEIRELFRGGEPDDVAFQIRQCQVFPSGRRHRSMGTRLRAKLYHRQRIRIPAEVAWDQFVLPRGVTARVLNGPLWHYAFASFGQLLRKQEAGMRRRVSGLPKSSRSRVVMRILFGLPLDFFKKFFIQGCWRGGIEGFAFSVLCALSQWIKYVMLYERDHCPSSVSRENSGSNLTQPASRRAA